MADLNRSKERIQVERTVDLDMERMEAPLAETISYLTELQAMYPLAQFDMHWSDYEDCDLRLFWLETETNDEFVARRRQVERQEEREIESRALAEARQRIDAEIERLRRERP